MARARQTHAFALFFPAAALHGALVVPLTLLAAYGGLGWPPGLLGAGHGHELVFGFALALVAGYTLGPQPPGKLWLLLGLWVAARILWLLAPSSWPGQLASPVFALILAWQVVPRFQAAKKWRNRITGPLILVLCLVPVIWFVIDRLLPAVSVTLAVSTTTLMHFGVLCLLLLMTFMGGRLIAPAAAGTLEKKGITLEARVQPRVEAALIITLLAAAVCYLVSPVRMLSAPLLILAGVLIALRTLRWKLWLCPERPDLLVLAAGYGWLATGSLVTGAALLLGLSPAASLHMVTIGALGTLSTSIMLRLHFQRRERRPPPGYLVISLGTLMTVAAITRFMAGPSPWASPFQLWLSAGAWSTAYLLVFVTMIIPRRAPGKMAPRHV
ncbi:NnrS family protein [Marinobacter bryozoorum]|uniref:NnrS family protein n=1 Tax=Marinobacter bryozoorum TaxID=256324 RepID=UPI002004D8CC|nr:NnrS family protein [Marinobacter bryozoorum]MCK7543828.1 NnrS family protein [Marinobacter bryozoorum]